MLRLSAKKKRKGLKQRNNFLPKVNIYNKIQANHNGSPVLLSCPPLQNAQRAGITIPARCCILVKGSVIFFVGIGLRDDLLRYL